MDQIYRSVKLILECLILEDGKLDKRSLETIRLVGESAKRSEDQCALLCQAGKFRDHFDVVRKITRTSVQPLDYLAKRLDRIKKIKKEPGRMNAAATLMEEEESDVLPSEIRRLTDGINESVQLTKDRCRVFHSVLLDHSQRSGSTGNSTWIFWQTSEHFTHVASETSGAIWDACYTISSQDEQNRSFSDDSEYVEIRNESELARLKLRSLIDARLEAITCSAEIQSKTIVRKALARLTQNSLSWDNFLEIAPTEDEPTSVSEQYELVHRDISSLFRDKCNAGIRSVDKACEKAIAETLSSQIVAVMKGHQALVALATHIGTWSEFLQHEEKILDDFMDGLADLSGCMQRTLDQLADHIGNVEFMSETWNFGTLHKAQQLADAIKHVRTRISANFMNYTWSGPSPGTDVTKQLSNLSKMKKILVDFRACDTVVVLGTFVHDMDAALHRAKYIRETSIIPVPPVVQVSSFTDTICSRQRADKLNCTAVQESSTSAAAMYQGYATNYFSSATVLRRREPPSKGHLCHMKLDLSDKLSDDSVREPENASDVFHDSLNVSAEFSDSLSL